MQTYSRKKGRFPAFDDEAGVKLAYGNQNGRVLFDGKDDLLTDYKLEAQDIFERPLPKVKRTRRVNLQEEPRSRELDLHKANLPNYHAEHTERKTVKLFEEPKPKEQTKTTNFSPYSGRGRSATPFAPKFVPSSLIPDDPADAVSPKELMQRMEKPRQSYLLFASEKEAQPALERKKTRQRLDRSLRGIMQEDNSKLEDSKYFHD